MKPLIIAALFATALSQTLGAEDIRGPHYLTHPFTPVEKPEASAPDALWYKIDGGGVVGVTEGLIVKFTDMKLFDAIVAKYKLTLKRPFGNNTYLFSTEDRKTTLDVANALSAENGVLYAEPDFIQKAGGRQ